MQPQQFIPSTFRRFLATTLHFCPFFMYAILRENGTLIIAVSTMYVFYAIVGAFREIGDNELIKIDNQSVYGPIESTKKYQIRIPVIDIDINRTLHGQERIWNRLFGPTHIYNIYENKLILSHSDFSRKQRSKILELIIEKRNILMNNFSNKTLLVSNLLQQEITSADYPQIQKLLDELVELNQIDATAVIIPHIFHQDIWVKTAVSNTIHQIVSNATSDQLAWLDTYIRSYSFEYRFGRTKWLNIKPTQLAGLSHFQDDAVSLVGILSMHNSGYVRETAVNHLTTITTGAELPFLLLRTNEWVASVRETAVSAVQERTTQAYAHHFVQHMPILMRLQERSRSQQAKIAKSIIQLLQSHNGQSALFSGFHLLHIPSRRSCFKIALDGECVDLSHVIPVGLKDPDPIIRTLMINKIAALSTDEIATYLPIMKADPFMPVRREALRLVLQHFPNQAEDELLQAISDENAGVRFEAQYHLKKRGSSLDFAQFYRDLIHEPDQTKLHIGIAGLGEVGKRGDVKEIRPFLTHPRIKIRKTAVKAVSKLNPDTTKEDLLHALQDTSPGVSREAKKAILYTRSQFSQTGNLWQIVKSSPHPHARTNALILLTTLQKWQNLFYLLSALEFENEIQLSVTDFIKRWLYKFNQSFTQPSSREKEQISKIYNDIEHLLPEQTKHQLNSILQSLN